MSSRISSGPLRPAARCSANSGAASGCTIAASATHKGALLRRPKPFRYTDGDQQRVSSGDTSLRFVVSQSQKRDVWPAASWGRK